MIRLYSTPIFKIGELELVRKCGIGHDDWECEIKTKEHSVYAE